MRIIKKNGFSLIQLIIVISILSILASYVFPKFMSLSRNSKISVLKSVKGKINTVVYMVKSAARLNGLSKVSSNPSGRGGNQSSFIIKTNIGTFEVDWRNLCPESKAELGDKLELPDFLNISTNLKTRVNNQYTAIGFTLPSSLPGNSGCYVLYDSFGFPDCTVNIIDDQC